MLQTSSFWPVHLLGQYRMILSADTASVLKSAAGTWYNYQTKAQYDEERRINI